MSKSVFSILPIVSNGFVAGKLTSVTKFLVVDAQEQPVHAKFYDTEADAQAVIDGLGNFSEGLSFAQAKYPGMADKAQKAKAGVIAEYLDWLAADRPVTELDTSEAAEAPEPEAAAEPAAPSADEAF